MAFLRKIIGCRKEPEPSLDCDYYQLDVNGRLLQSKVPLSELPPKDTSKLIVRFVVISDTHETHHLFGCPDSLPHGDVLLHCGDILLSDRLTMSPLSKKRIRDFTWMNRQPHAVKIAVAGNHDKEFEKCGVALIKSWAGATIYAEHELLEIPLSLAKLDIQQTSTKTAATADDTLRVNKVSGPAVPQVLLRCLASPWSFGSSPNKAFQGDASYDALMTLAQIMGSKQQLAEQESGQQQLPVLNVVMTHLAGNCRDLRAVLQTAKPVLHFGGHYHEQHGPSKIGGIPSFNAAMLRGRFGREELQNVTVVDCEL